MKGERLIQFPFQEKKINDGEDLPVVDRLMEENKTVDKLQMVAGGVLVLGSVAFPVLAPVAAATLGGSVVSHEIGRDELRVRREKRIEKQADEQLKKAA